VNTRRAAGWQWTAGGTFYHSAQVVRGSACVLSMSEPLNQWPRN
jgi:hypothetical protein